MSNFSFGQNVFKSRLSHYAPKCACMEEVVKLLPQQIYNWKILDEKELLLIKYSKLHCEKRRNSTDVKGPNEQWLDPCYGHYDELLHMEWLQSLHLGCWRLRVRFLAEPHTQKLWK